MLQAMSSTMSKAHLNLASHVKHAIFVWDRDDTMLVDHCFVQRNGEADQLLCSASR